MKAAEHIKRLGLQGDRYSLLAEVPRADLERFLEVCIRRRIGTRRLAGIAVREWLELERRESGMDDTARTP